MNQAYAAVGLVLCAVVAMAPTGEVIGGEPPPPLDAPSLTSSSPAMMAWVGPFVPPYDQPVAILVSIVAEPLLPNELRAEVYVPSDTLDMVQNEIASAIESPARGSPSSSRGAPTTPPSDADREARNARILARVVEIERSR